jgi:endonuclease III-like uncharacterized protein
MVHRFFSESRQNGYRALPFMSWIPTAVLMQWRISAVLREGLLSVNGIGEETADSILWYGFSRASFVLDAYTDKILRYTGIHEPRTVVKSLSEHVPACANKAYRQTHAHIVEYAKEFCIKRGVIHVFW